MSTYDIRLLSNYTALMTRPQPPWVPIGVDGIAEHLGVTINTVVTWRRRSAKEWVHVEKFPEPAGTLSNRDWWWLPDIQEWAKRTGRLPAEGS